MKFEKKLKYSFLMLIVLFLVCSTIEISLAAQGAGQGGGQGASSGGGQGSSSGGGRDSGSSQRSSQYGGQSSSQYGGQSAGQTSQSASQYGLTQFASQFNYQWAGQYYGQSASQSGTQYNNQDNTGGDGCDSCFSITCHSNSDCGQDSYSEWSANYCKNNNVYHSRTYFNKGCSSGSCFTDITTQEELVQECSDTCNNGQCISFECDQDSDCGTNGFIGDSYCNNDGIYQLYRTYDCINSNTINSQCTHTDAPVLKQDCGQDSYSEWSINYCKDNNVYHSKTYYDRGCSLNSCFVNQQNQEFLVEECSDTCSSGSCVDIACYSNSDCGTDSYITNPYCNGNDSYRDFKVHFCVYPGTVNSYCSQVVNPHLLEECSYTCDNGQCITPSVICGDGVVKSTEECDDGNTRNGDGCSSSCKITYECSDGVDNDGDSLIDMADPHCSGPKDNSESISKDNKVHKFEIISFDLPYLYECQENGINVKIKNKGTETEIVQLYAFIPELGIEEKVSSSIYLYPGQARWQTINIDLPCGIPGKPYLVEVLAKNRDYSHYRYMSLMVIN